MSANDQPRPHVGAAYAAMLAIAMVVGAGIFKSPALVAENAGAAPWYFAAWALGGAISLIGAFCYAELASTFPNAGGDYHFLKLAYGRTVAFCFAWSRFAIINTGSIALLGYVFGDYMNEVAPLGENGAALYAALSVLGLTLLNLRGLAGAGARGDFALTGLEVAGVAMMIAAGGWIVLQGMAPASFVQTASPAPPASFGYALVFALLAYGGWNEIATLSAETRGGPRAIAHALVWSVVAIAALYLAAAWAFWRGLGLPALAGSAAPAADLMARAFGADAGWLTALAIACAAFTSINATIVVGGRTTYAAARDFPTLARLGRWDGARAIPAAAYIAQGAVSMALVVWAGFGRGFADLVDYTAPVFWLFMALSGLALIVLRFTHAQAPRPFRAPLYPLAPLVFALASLAMVGSSVAYVGTNALFGIAVLGAGALLALALRKA